MVVMLLPINAGILIYTAKNAADLRESRETIVALKRSIDGLKAQVDKQGRNFAGNAKADEVAVIRQQTESLQKTIFIMNERMRSGLFAARAGGALVLSAPGKEPAQYFAPSPAAPPAGYQTPDESLTSIDAKGVSSMTCRATSERSHRKGSLYSGRCSKPRLHRNLQHNRPAT